MDVMGAKQLVSESGKMLLKEKLAARTWGNISCRVTDKAMVITPSGLGYDGMEPNDIVCIDMDTGHWEGERKPSSEKGIHKAAYRQFSDAGFVIHTHQTYASAIGLAGFDSLSLTKEEESALGGVALAEYGLSSTKKLAGNVSDALRSGAHIILMVHHGAVIVGKDREEAFGRARLLEEVCRRACKGQPKTDPAFDEELANILTSVVKKEFGYAANTACPAVLACASSNKAVRAQLDDMAQMIGPRLVVIKPEEGAVIKALRNKDVVLVPGVGAICRASTQDDLNALCLLAEKSCVCWLHTQAMGIGGRLSAFDVRLMRAVYKMKYSKKMGG